MKYILSLLTDMLGATLFVTVLSDGCPLWFHQPQYPKELLEEEPS